MTADLINLRRKRKEKARAERTVEAAENRARFGRSGAEKARAQLENEQVRDRLDGHRLAGLPDLPKS